MLAKRVFSAIFLIRSRVILALIGLVAKLRKGGYHGDEVRHPVQGGLAFLGLIRRLQE